MKGLLLIAGVLALAGLPAQAGTSVSISIGGGYHCAYSAGCFPHRSLGYVGFPGYYYGGYPYAYSGYAASYYPVSYDVGAPAPTYVQPTQSTPAPAPVAPATTPTPAPVAVAPAPAPAQLPFGILDVNGFVHSPYSDSIFKVPGVRNAQLVYDPLTGKPFLVR